MAKSFEEFRRNHEEIFGKRTFREMALSDGINRHQHRIFTGDGKVTVITTTKRTEESKKKPAKRRKKKSLCPHCATMNFIRVKSKDFKCKKCGFEKTIWSF